MNTVRHVLQIKGFDIWMIAPDQTVFEALKRMADKDVGALLVMRGEELLGIITERDYARKVILRGKSSKETPVSTIMTAPVVTIHPDQTVEEAQQLMLQKRFRHLPVVENGAVVGVISIGDVLRHIIYRQRKTLKEMEEKLLKGSTLML